MAVDRRHGEERGVVNLVLCWIALMVLAACEQPRSRGLVERAWTEDVQMDDGSSIQVRRTAKLNITNSWAGDAYNAVEVEATLMFMGELSGLPRWSAPQIALVLYRDRDTGEWTLVTTTTSCEIWERNGKPKPPYWEYRLKAEGWVAMPLSSTSIGRPANLLHIYDKQLPGNHITEVEREQLQSDRRISRTFREVWGDPDQYVCGEGNPSK
jgi:hypothetical protein